MSKNTDIREQWRQFDKYAASRVGAMADVPVGDDLPEPVAEAIKAQDDAMTAWLDAYSDAEDAYHAIQRAEREETEAIVKAAEEDKPLPKRTTKVEDAERELLYQLTIAQQKRNALRKAKADVEKAIRDNIDALRPIAKRQADEGLKALEDAVAEAQRLVSEGMMKLSQSMTTTRAILPAHGTDIRALSLPAPRTDNLTEMREYVGKARDRVRRLGLVPGDLDGLPS